MRNLTRNEFLINEGVIMNECHDTSNLKTDQLGYGKYSRFL